MTELNFKGKEFVYNHHLSVPFRPLEMHAEKGIGAPRLDGNLIIQGDNLQALKALLPIYAGKMDCIFIDPPYNTGNEGWAYNDNVNSPMIKEWLAANPIGIEDGLRHDKWCAMMWPRLRLLHELLAETGSFWMTLDDNEVHRAKLLLDEVFGSESYSAHIVWQSSDNSNNDAKNFSVDKNHILVYGKSDAWRPFHLDDAEKRKHFKNPDDDPKGPYFDGNPVDSPNPRENLKYKIETPNGGEINHPKNGWRWEKPTLLEKLKSGEIRFSADETRIIRRTYLRDMKGLPPSDLWIRLDKFGHNRNAKYELQSIFGGDSPFPTPKPSKLLEAILDLAVSTDATVLDSFAGSGTTAHAVLKANKLDGGSRRFILVEMEDYSDTLTAERVRRVINGYAFKGTQKTELLRERINWRTLEKPNALTDKVQAIENLHGHEFDRIKKEIKDSELVVTGEKAFAERAEGLGGEFTYCTLGPAVELDKILTGETLPDFAALGAVLFHTATNHAFNPASADFEKGYLGTSSGQHVWLIYRPDLEWLKSPEAALTLSKAREFVAAHPGDRHLVFAPARYVSQKLLAEENLPVEFVPLPFALYRIERS
ncbi:site-specific DNA-methyltransferase [Agrobacterium larrymoorei]|uniref:site-specific DNA-methyltransferase (adenine-specific) n=1 Tax=Agrobacterium larrymoorei TaxID=160699 RepID=A0ABU0UGX3_9HYPH|nr:site-specific DNA-methyltransferase [Agrobacterium larrymoorei]MDQ1184187.1 adenine-specific DNA-methyltransferase [Agrobacterium larrymoorei]